MGAFTAIGSDSNIQDKTYLREIEQGFYERFVCADAASRPTWATSTGSTAADTNIQQASFWAARQNAVSTLITNASHKFLQAGSYGVPPAAMPDVNNESSIATHTAASTLWALVSGNSAGPRRYTNHPDAGGSPSYGACQAGDIIDYWLIEDLQLALCYLRYVLIDSADVSEGITYESGNSSAWNEGSYSVYGAQTYSNLFWDDAQDDHDASIAAFGSKSNESGLLARWRMKMYYSYLVGIPFGDNVYAADSYTACRNQSVTLPTAAYNHKLWIGGTWAALGAASDGYYGIHSSTHGAYVTSGNVGVVGVDTAFTAATSRALDMRNMVSRLFDRNITTPSSRYDVRDYDCKVTSPFALAEWEWTKGEMA